MLKPHYFGDAIWDNINKHWESERFEKASANGWRNGAKKNFNHKSGAVSFCVRRSVCSYLKYTLILIVTMLCYCSYLNSLCYACLHLQCYACLMEWRKYTNINKRVIVVVYFTRCYLMIIVSLHTDLLHIIQ